MRAILQNALEKIKEKEKRRGIVRFFVSSEVRYVKERDAFAMLKSGRATIPKFKEKAIRQGLNEYGITELLRVALEDEIKKILKRERLRDNCRVEALSYPLPAVANVGRYEDVVYIDVKKCFYTIYSRFGLDVRFRCKGDNKTVTVTSVGKGIITGKNSELVSALKEHKKERNIIVGLMSSCFTLVYRGGKFERQFYRSKVLNLELRGFICALLNALIQPYQSGIIYWNVDGGFVRHEVAEDLISDFLDCGFDIDVVKVKEVDISRIGGWRCEFENGNSKVTGHYGKRGRNVFNILKVINREEFLRWVKRLI